MKVRVKNIIETLRRLPPPTRAGEVRMFDVLMQPWEINLDRDKSTMADMISVTVESREYRNGDDRRWFEWVIEI